MNTTQTTKEWIVSNPFNRRQYSSITNGRVDYSGALYNSNGENLTYAEYMSAPERASKYINPRIVSDDEFFELYQQSERDMVTTFKEVTEEQYFDALECLPPMKWHNISSDLNVFFISEATTGVLHSCYIAQRSTGKYYSALRSRLETDEELNAVFRASI